MAFAVPMRISEAMAMMAPAPAHTPSMAAMIGCGAARIALTSSPVMRVKSRSPLVSISVSGLMISNTSPPEQKLPPAPVIDDRLDAFVAGGGAKNIAELGVAFEGQRILALRTIERDGRDRALDRKAHMLRRVAGERQRYRIGARHRGSSPAIEARAEILVLARSRISTRFRPAKARKKSRRSSPHARAPWRETRGALRA